MERTRSICVLAAAALWFGCAQEDLGTAPPKDGFYYPVSVAAVERTPGQPILYVVSSNFDLRYNRGSVVAVDTAKLEKLDGPVDAAVDPDVGWANIDSFGGQIAAYSPATPTVAGEVRLFVPTRSANKLYVLSADGAKLSCLPDPSVGQDCLGQGIRLEDPADKNIRSVDPFGVTVDGTKVHLTHLHQSDNPPLTGENRTSYLVTLDAEALDAPPTFLDVGPSPAQGAAVTPMGLYLTGRTLSSTELINSQALRTVIDGKVADVGLSSSTRLFETRGVALATDRARLFATTRSPDGLIVLDISPNPATGTANNRLLSFTTLPFGASELVVVPRPGQRDLIAVSCTASNSVALYDDEIGEVTGLVRGVLEPFALARSSIAGNDRGQRLFVASFGNHTVDVIDIADVARPRSAVLAGHLGFGAHRPLGVTLPEGQQ